MTHDRTKLQAAALYLRRCMRREMAARPDLLPVLYERAGFSQPALRDDQSYSQAHYDQVCAQFGDPAMLAKYSLIFVDSITVAGRLCLQWAKGQPQAFSEKTGKPDTRGAYGLHASELVG